jgi:hypothetical protein
MNNFRKTILVALILAMAIPCFADVRNVTPVYPDDGSGGGCANEYNNCLRSCDSSPLGTFTVAGCKADCFTSYWGCVYRSATS